MFSALSLVALVVAASPSRVCLLPLPPSEGVSEMTAGAVTEALAAELRRLGLTLLTQEEISTLLSVERQKELLACGTDSCAAEIAGALDVDRLVSGKLSKLGESWVVHWKVLDARKAVGLAHASRRLRGGTIDDVLDVLPAMAKELFPQAARPPSPEPVQAQAAALPAPWAEEPLRDKVDRTKLQLLTDGQGRYLAVVPYGGLEGPLFAGDAKNLHRQRVFGASSEKGKQFSLTFWEPRARVPAEAMLSYRDGRYTLICRDREIPLTPVAAAQAGRLLARSRLLEPRWRRRAYALARDAEGNFFYVDQAREPDGNTDFHLYLGTQGRMAGQPVRVLAHDSEGGVLEAPQGKLRLSHARREAEWIQGSSRTQLTWLEVESNAVMIYTSLGAYTGQALGTPCDAAFR